MRTVVFSGPCYLVSNVFCRYLLIKTREPIVVRSQQAGYFAATRENNQPWGMGWVVPPISGFHISA